MLTEQGLAAAPVAESGGPHRTREASRTQKSPGQPGVLQEVVLEVFIGVDGDAVEADLVMNMGTG